MHRETLTSVSKASSPSSSRFIRLSIIFTSASGTSHGQYDRCGRGCERSSQPTSEASDTSVAPEGREASPFSWGVWGPL